MDGRDLVRSVGMGGAAQGFRMMRQALRRRGGAAVPAARGTERARVPGAVTGVDPEPGGGVLRFARARLEVRVTDGGAVFWGWDGASPTPSYALDGEPPGPDPRAFLEPDRNGGWRVVSERVTVTVSRHGAVEVRTPGGAVLRCDLPPRWWDAADGGGARWTQRSEVPADARFFGLGGRAAGLRLRDGTYRLWDTSPGAGDGPDDARSSFSVPVQWVVADAGTHLVFHDNTWDGRVTLREGEEGEGSGHDRSGTSELRMEGGPLRCWVVVGTPARLAQAWAGLTGRAALPPAWALGHHRAVGTAGEEAVRREIAWCRERGVPLAAVHPAPGPGGARGGTLAEEVRREGVRLVPSVTPAVRVAPEDPVHAAGADADVFVRDEEGRPVGGGPVRARPGEGPFVLSRSGWAGAQRYGGTWFGGVDEGWPGLRASLALMVGLGLSGVPYCGPEVAGQGAGASPELVLRRLQLASFATHFRTRAGEAREWELPPAELGMAREVWDARERLHPYFVTLSHLAHRTGAPCLRPVWWHAPEDRGLRACEDAFLLGDALLVAPVLSRGAVRRAVRLPHGRWYDTVTEEAFDGPGQVLLDAPLSRTPVLARAGGVVPVRGERGGVELEVWAPVRGRTGGGLLVRDAGDGWSAAGAEEFTVRRAGDGSVRVEDGDGRPAGLPVRVRGARHP